MEAKETSISWGNGHGFAGGFGGLGVAAKAHERVGELNEGDGIGRVEPGSLKEKRESVGGASLGEEEIGEGDEGGERLWVRDEGDLEALNGSVNVAHGEIRLGDLKRKMRRRGIKSREQPSFAPNRKLDVDKRMLVKAQREYLLMNSSIGLSDGEAIEVSECFLVALGPEQRLASFIEKTQVVGVL